MIACPACGEENPERFKLCGFCGTPLDVAGAARREVRRMVTILFADVTGSTAIGERLDPESLRALMGRYFAAIRKIVEHHGGMVEKFIGDAVMAVFGLPTLHEDDALRAVTAAAEIKVRLAALNEELEHSRGLTIVFRTGVNTGEVVAGDPSTGGTLVTGDTVNTAARLEQAAQPGEILLGLTTYRLVRDAVVAEKLDPISAKGKAHPMQAYRLHSITAGAAGHRRRLDAPMVGRERELARLRQAYEQAVADRSCHLFTLLGSAGAGKSRLAREFLASVATEATVLRGRCLSYGEGITYWPVGEVVRAGAGIAESDSTAQALAKVEAVLAGERDAAVIAQRVASAIGVSSESAPQEEIFWATRKLLEHLGFERPLVVVFEDIHWAEPTFLDLIEYVADLARDAPLLVLCPARPELLDKRPGWGGGKLNATTLLLEALPPDQTDQLIRQLPGGSALPDRLRTRVLEAAEGNPLYVEEMLGMLLDEGLLVERGDGWVATAELEQVTVPPTVQALLAARLDGLPPSERSIAEHASVVGRVFEEAAVSVIAPESLRPQIPAGLIGLVRKELIRPERSDVFAGDAFKFRHQLIRDAAYNGLAKSERAELHERFAGWLEAAAGERIAQFEEILGYHLEQAYRFRMDLGELLAARAVGERAGQWLARSGRLALDRGDVLATRVLLERALDVLPSDHPQRGRSLLDLADAFVQLGEYDTAEATVAAVREVTRGRSGTLLEAAAQVLGMVIAALRGHTLSIGEIRAAIDTLQESDELEWSSRAWNLLCVAEDLAGNQLKANEAAERAAELAELAGDSRHLGAALGNVIIGYLNTLSVADARVAISSVRDRAGGNRRVLAEISQAEAFLSAMEGEFEAARAFAQDAEERFREIGQPIFAAYAHGTSGWIELMASQPGVARPLLASSRDVLLQAGDGLYSPWVSVMLAEALHREGNDAGAVLPDLAELTDEDRALVFAKRAKIAAKEGDSGEARKLAELADTALPVGSRPEYRVEVLIDLAQALDRADPAAARAALDRARAICDAKGYVVLGSKVRSMLSQLTTRGVDRR